MALSHWASQIIKAQSRQSRLFRVPLLISLATPYLYFSFACLSLSEQEEVDGNHIFFTGSYASENRTHSPPLSKRTVGVHRQDVAHQYKQVYYLTDMKSKASQMINSRKDYKTFQPIIQWLECTGRVISICTSPKNNHCEVLKWENIWSNHARSVKAK